MVPWHPGTALAQPSLALCSPFTRSGRRIRGATTVRVVTILVSFQAPAVPHWRQDGPEVRAQPLHYALASIAPYLALQPSTVP